MASFNDFRKSIKAGYKSMVGGEQETADSSKEGNIKLTSDGEAVKVVDDSSWAESFGKGIGNVVGMAGFGVQWVYDHLSADKQDIDRELYGLKKGDQAILTDEGRTEYLQKLYDYDKLIHKDKISAEDLANMSALSADLQEYTVADRPHTFWSWIKNFGLDSMRNSTFLGPEYARTKVNTKQILKNIDTQTKRIFNITDAPEKQTGLRTVTKEEYEDMKEGGYNKKLNDSMLAVAKKLQQQGYKAERNPGGRESTIDEIMGDLEAVMSDRSTALQLEAFRNGLHKFTAEKTPVLNRAINNNIDNLVDMAGFILAYDGDSDDAYREYLKDHDNPFVLDLEKYKNAKDITTYEKNIISTSIIGRAGDVLRVDGTDPYYGADAATMVDQLIRLDSIAKNASKVGQGEEFMGSLGVFWDSVMYGSAVIGGYMSAGFGIIGSALANIYRHTLGEGEDGEFMNDLNSYMFGLQNSTIFNTKENHQNDYVSGNPITNIGKFIVDYYSVADDISTAYLEGKLITFPTKLVEVGKLGKIVVKTAEATKKIENTAEKTKKIVTAGEKIKGFANGESYLKKVGTGIKNYFKNKWENNVNGLKALRELDTGTAIKLGSQNFVRWIAEEALTSAAFQGLTPYDYTMTDLGMDVTGAMISGWMRAKEFNNKLGLTKLQSQDAGWVTWWFRDVYKDSNGKKLSDAQVKEKMSGMTHQDIKDLAEKIKQASGVISEDALTINNSQFLSKAQKIGQAGRKAINDLADTLIKETEDNLKLEFSRSADSKINGLVKKVRRKGADGKFHVSFEWNNKGKSEKKFKKEVATARANLYGGKTVDNITSITKYRQRINAVKNNVKKNLPSIVARSVKAPFVKIGGREYAKSNILEKVNGKWRFKKGVSKDLIKVLLNDQVKKQLDKVTKSRQTILKGAKDTHFGINISAHDEVGVTFGLHQLLNIYLNNVLIRKKFKKDDIITGLKAMGGAVYEVFKYWLKETYDNKSVDDFTLRELISAVKEFGSRYDTKLFPEWNLAHRTSNMDGGVKTPDQYIHNMTFEQAQKQNPDLKYMGQNLFFEIAGDTSISPEQKEIKLRNFRRGGKGTDLLAMEGDVSGHMGRGTHFFGIDEKKSAGRGRKAFNDTYEEKLVFGTGGKIYLKVNEEAGSVIVGRHANQDGITPFRRKGEGVIEATYERKELSRKTGGATYFVYDRNGVRIASITTLPDVDFSKLGDKPYPGNIFPKSRLMSIELFGDLSGKGVSADFEVIKGDTNQSRIFDTDIDLTFKDDTVYTSGTYTENGKKYKRTSTLKQWHNFSLFVSHNYTSYDDFVKLIPGYTDRVSKDVFDMIMEDKGIPSIDKQKLLISIMTNKKIHMSADGMVIKTGSSTFVGAPYKKRVPIYNKRNEIQGYNTLAIPGEGELYRREYVNGGTVLFTRGDNTTEAYQFAKSEQNGLYVLYKDKDLSKPAGVIFIGDDGVKSYLTEGKKRIYATQLEFLDNKNLEEANEVVSGRYGAVNGNISAPEGDEYFKKIYKEIYGKNITEKEYHRLRSTPGMTPERYLNEQLNKILKSEFGSYVKIRYSSWENVARQIRVAKAKIDLANLFKNKYGETGLSDGQIIQVATRILKENSEGKPKYLTQAEKDIRDILYGKGKVILSDAELLGVYGYSMFGIEPKELKSETLTRLRVRRDRILLAVFKDANILNLSNGEKEALVAFAKRKGLMEWKEDDLIQDIANYPEFYSAVIDALRGPMEEIEKSIDISDEQARITEINSRLAELESDGVNKKVYKKTGPNTTKIQEKINEYQEGAVNDLLEQTRQEAEAAAEAGDKVAMDAATSKRMELEEYNARLEEEKEYKRQKRDGAYTQEQFDYLAKLRMQGQDGSRIREVPLSQQEVQDRIKHIRSRMPGMRIIEVDPTTGATRLTGFTEEQKVKYASQIDAAAQRIMNNEANAAHVRELHAIVLNPQKMLSSTLGHEWFHEAVALTSGGKWTKGRIEELFYDTYTKHKEDIEAFAEARGYDNAYMEISETSAKEYQKQITEEWLAERFGEYVNNRYNEALGLSNDLIEFFKYLWEQMKTLFSDTDALELFEDIYEGRMDYSDVTIDLNPRDVGTTRFSLLSDDAKAFFDKYNPEDSDISFGDSFNGDTLRKLKYNGLDDKDLKVGTTRGFIGRGAFIPEIQSVLSNGTRASFNQLYESVCKSSAVSSADKLTDYIYGRSFVSDFSYVTDSLIDELRRTGGIVHQENGFTVKFLSDPFEPDLEGAMPTRGFKFIIELGDGTVFYIDNHAEELKPMYKRYENVQVMKGIDRYSMIMDAIIGRLNDDVSKRLSRTSFNQNIAKYLQSSNTQKELASLELNVLSNDVINLMIESLEKAINKCDHIEHPDYANLDNNVKEIARKAYDIYMFNRYVPHGKGLDVISKSLFNRKANRTISLLKEIDSLGRDDVKWAVHKENAINSLVQISIDVGDGTPRYIGWHVLNNAVEKMKKKGLDIDGHDEIEKVMAVRNKSIFSVSKDDYGKSLSSATKSRYGVKNFVIGKYQRDVLKETRPEIFRDLKISYQLYPFIVDGKKYVYENGKAKPVTLISEGRHLENKRYMNLVHRKYDISIENASPDLKKEIKQLTKGSKKVSRGTWAAAKRRILNTEYRDLIREKGRLEQIIQDKMKAEKDLINNPVYRHAKKIQGVLEENPDIAEMIKEADEAKMIREQELALKTEVEEQINNIVEAEPRKAEVQEEPITIKQFEQQPTMEISEWIAEMEKDSQRYVSDSDLPDWKNCSLSMLEKAKSIDYIYSKYGEDIDYAIKYIQNRIMQGEASDASVKDIARIQKKINTIENNVREGAREQSVDARRESIRESDLGENYNLDQYDAAEEFDRLRDTREIDIYSEYHGIAAENDKLKRLIDLEGYSKGSFIESVAKEPDFDKRLAIADMKIKDIDSALKRTNGRKRTEDLIVERNRWEYLKSEAERAKEEAEFAMDEGAGYEAIYNNTNTLSTVCSL